MISKSIEMLRNTQSLSARVGKEELTRKECTTMRSYILDLKHLKMTECNSDSIDSSIRFEKGRRLGSDDGKTLEVKAYLTEALCLFLFLSEHLRICLEKVF